MGKILITGGSGLIGSHIAEYFTGKGEDVCCLVRRGSNTEFLRSINMELVYGDITETETLTGALKQGIDYIIHTAAYVNDWGNYEIYEKVNVAGTLNFLRAANECGIKDITITGSISCYGEEDSPDIKSEDFPYNSHYNYFMDKVFPSSLNYYRDTKAKANIKAMEYAGANELNLTILEPGWVYGEREFHSGFYDFLKSLKSNPIFFPGSKRNKFHTIYARDLAKIYYLAYKKKLQGINKILAVSTNPEYQYKLLDMFCTIAGYNIPARIPKSIIYAPAFLTELFYTVFRLKNPPPISRGRINIFYDNIEYSHEKLRHLLGFEEDYSLEEGIENTVNWYKHNKYL